MKEFLPFWKVIQILKKSCALKKIIQILKKFLKKDTYVNRINYKVLEDTIKFAHSSAYLPPAGFLSREMVHFHFSFTLISCFNLYKAFMKYFIKKELPGTISNDSRHWPLKMWICKICANVSEKCKDLTTASYIKYDAYAYTSVFTLWKSTPVI